MTRTAMISISVNLNLPCREMETHSDAEYGNDLPLHVDDAVDDFRRFRQRGYFYYLNDSLDGGNVQGELTVVQAECDRFVQYLQRLFSSNSPRIRRWGPDYDLSLSNCLKVS